jgi:hypothetical protein
VTKAAVLSQNEETAAAEQEPTSKLAEGQFVEIAGEQVWIAPLSLNQWSALARVVMRAIARAKSNERRMLAEMLAKLNDGNLSEEENTTISVEAALLAWDDDVLASLYGIIIDRPSAWAKEHFDMREFLRVLNVFTDYNPLWETARLFTVVVKRG